MKIPTNLEKTIVAGLLCGLKCDKGLITSIDINHPSGRMVCVEYEKPFNGAKYATVEIENVKPHLLPLSCLTEGITIKGYNDDKSFVPIVELSKLIFVYPPNWIEFVNNDLLSVAKNKLGYFVYNKTGHFYYVNILDGGLSSEVACQMEMFELLDRWHFNRFNLPEDQFINAKISKAYEA